MALGTGNYAKKKNQITLSKALATFGYETWSSLDKGRKFDVYFDLFPRMIPAILIISM